jgi:3-hydroxyacyl-CoA dehydrogenase
MRWGYNWDLGPFQTWDALGFVETVDRMQPTASRCPSV